VTRVCLLGDPDVNLTYELLSRETARDALATYEIEEPFENSVAVDTVSLGAAVSLLNDLNWYLVRFVDEALVREPSVSPTSGSLATSPARCATAPSPRGDRSATEGVRARRRPAGRTLYVRRTQGETPEYDLRDVDETVIVRVSESEFSG